MNTTTQSKISERKQHHLDICQHHNVEGNLSSGFKELHFIHTACPEIDVPTVDLSVSFLKKQISLPLFISCMTGGSTEGQKVNEILAEAAQLANIPFGLGSIRVLFEHPERLADFQVRSLAQDIPLIANIGAVQLRDIPFSRIQTLLSALDVDALAVHLNCGQELFQEGGDRNFKGLLEAISRAVEYFSLPLIIKETGFGIRPSLVKQFVDMGVAYVDVAGAGGTNWILVEEERKEKEKRSGKEFTEWGLLTPVLIDASKGVCNRLLASGGLRSGMDLAKSIALGASLGGMALPFIRAALKGGKEAVLQEIETIKNTLLAVLVMTGCPNIAALQKTPLLKSLAFEHQVKTLQKIEFK